MGVARFFDRVMLERQCCYDTCAFRGLSVLRWGGDSDFPPLHISMGILSWLSGGLYCMATVALCIMFFLCRIPCRTNTAVWVEIKIKACTMAWAKYLERYLRWGNSHS